LTLLLFVSLIAMQLTDEVNWDAFDFAVSGSMLLGAGAACELAARMTVNIADRLMTARKLGEAMDLSGFRRLLDIGGGAGAYDNELCKEYEALRATVPYVAAIAG
jgi:hypothetical protein